MKTLVQARVESDLKMNAESILSNYGIDLPTLFRMTLHATINAKGVPFPVAQNNMTLQDYEDFEIADKAFNDFEKSGKKTQSIHHLAKELGV